MAQVSEYRRHQAANAGAKAAHEGKPRSANTRQHGTIYFDDWCDGYDHVANATLSQSEQMGEEG